MSGHAHIAHMSAPRQSLFGFKTGPDQRGAGDAAGAHVN